VEAGKLFESNIEEATKNCHEILSCLPEINRKVATYMINFLRIFCEPANQKKNKMSIANIAMVFAPNFLRCPSDDPSIIFESTK
jgi:hypothetical protein